MQPLRYFPFKRRNILPRRLKHNVATGDEGFDLRVAERLKEPAQPFHLNHILPADVDGAQKGDAAFEKMVAEDAHRRQGSMMPPRARRVFPCRRHAAWFRVNYRGGSEYD